MLASSMKPRLERRTSGPCAWWSDPALEERGVHVAFTERGGGTSAPPFASLNLAGHVGDDPAAVDRNRERLLDALGMGAARAALTTAEQVHGSHVVVVEERRAGAGAFVTRSRPPVPSCDGLVTALSDTPLLMCFADCVPVIVVAPGPVVAVAHAGWRGALAGIAGKVAHAALELADGAGAVAYIGPHIGDCHYPVDHGVMARFVDRFGEIATGETGGLDLGAVVTADLIGAGVPASRIASLGVCTSEQTDHFFSHRAEGGLTGRHGALACVSSRTP